MTISPLEIIHLNTPKRSNIVIGNLPHFLQPLVIEALCGFPDSVAVEDFEQHLVKTTFWLKAHVKHDAVILVSARRHLDARLERFVHNIMNRSANSVTISKDIGYTKHKFFTHKLQTFK
jgi:hypothetical protein